MVYLLRPRLLPPFLTITLLPILFFSPATSHCIFPIKQTLDNIPWRLSSPLPPWLTSSLPHLHIINASTADLTSAHKPRPPPGGTRLYTSITREGSESGDFSSSGVFRVSRQCNTVRGSPSIGDIYALVGWIEAVQGEWCRAQTGCFGGGASEAWQLATATSLACSTGDKEVWFPCKMYRQVADVVVNNCGWAALAAGMIGFRAEDGTGFDIWILTDSTISW